MHAIKDRAVVVDGQIVVRPIMVVALTYDHRLLDGREAVTFLGTSVGQSCVCRGLLTCCFSQGPGLPGGPEENASVGMRVRKRVRAGWTELLFDVEQYTSSHCPSSLVAGCLCPGPSDVRILSTHAFYPPRSLHCVLIRYLSYYSSEDRRRLFKCRIQDSSLPPVSVRPSRVCASVRRGGRDAVSSARGSDGSRSVFAETAHCTVILALTEALSQPSPSGPPTLSDTFRHQQSPFRSAGALRNHPPLFISLCSRPPWLPRLP